MLSPQGNEAKAINLWHAGQFRIATSDQILAEYYAVLSKPKFRQSPDDVALFLAPFISHQPRVQPARALSISPHEPDNRLLECAEAAHADFLITGNLKHFPPIHGATRILNARSFLDLISAA